MSAYPPLTRCLLDVVSGLPSRHDKRVFVGVEMLPTGPAAVIQIDGCTLGEAVALRDEVVTDIETFLEHANQQAAPAGVVGSRIGSIHGSHSVAVYVTMCREEDAIRFRSFLTWYGRTDR